MKTIGLIGGMSWESSMEYYRIINEEVRTRWGGFHSTQSIMYSVDFEGIEKYQRKNQWDEAGKVLINAAQSLERGGADFIVLCTNTMHKLADKIQGHVNIPFLHIADATADVIISQGIKTVGLLGTRYTMEQEFYKSRLENKDIKVLIPEEDARNVVHTVIYEELCLGKIIKESKEHYIEIIDELVAQGATGIILGCTEIGLLVKQTDSKVPLFDTTFIHAVKAVDFALK